MTNDRRFSGVLGQIVLLTSKFEIKDVFSVKVEQEDDEDEAPLAYTRHTPYHSAWGLGSEGFSLYVAYYRRGGDNQTLVLVETLKAFMLRYLYRVYTDTCWSC